MQKMRIVTMQLGMLATNCYLVINEETGELVIIDPAGEADRILVRVRQMKARPVAVLLTHGHFDHIGAVASLQKTYSIPVCAMAEEQELLQDAWLLTAQALLLQAGKPKDGTLPEEAELLSRSLSSRRLEGLSALLRQYSAECAYNVGAGHVLGALCAQWERLLHATR